MVPCLVALAPGTAQLQAPLVLREAIVKLKGMPALWAECPPARPPWGGQVDAGAATDHHPAGDDPRRGD
jgi:hypothetical protein